MQDGCICDNMRCATLQRATDVLKEPALLRGCPLLPGDSPFGVTAELLVRLEADVGRCVEADWLQAPAMDAVRHNAGARPRLHCPLRACIVAKGPASRAGA